MEEVIFMTRYHLNHEGKIYPCRAKVLRCPYGEGMHADTKEELYYKSMKMAKTQEPSIGAAAEIKELGRLKSLSRASYEIERSPAPVELIVSTLGEAIEDLESRGPESFERNPYQYAFDNGVRLVDGVLDYGLPIPENVPDEIAREGRKAFMKRTGGRPGENAGATRNKTAFIMYSDLKNMIDEFDQYYHVEKFKLTEENYEGTLAWLKRDFNQFSHDLNTSKLLTQPIFYGNLEKGKETIRNMDDFELLSAYDDYLVSDKEIMENVRLANNFVYEPRSDLSDKANAVLKEWYDRNRKIVKTWKRDTSKRVVLSLEMAKELDRRGLRRQDRALRK